MPFDFAAAQPLLKQAKRFVSDATQCREEADYATLKYCAYYTFFFCMQAFLCGGGEDIDTHSKTLERFRQRYLDTGILAFDTLYPQMELALKIHNEEAYEDEDLCSSEGTEQLMQKAELFCRCTDDLLENARKAAEDDRAAKELALVEKVIALAQEFDESYREENGERFMVYENHAALYEIAKTNLNRMKTRHFDDVLEAYATCSLWLIRYDGGYDKASEQELREMIGVCRELSRSDPVRWTRQTADICESLADRLLGREPHRLYKEALQLYRRLYSETGDDWDRECIMNLLFKLGTREEDYDD